MDLTYITLEEAAVYEGMSIVVWHQESIEIQMSTT